MRRFTLRGAFLTAFPAILAVAAGACSTSPDSSVTTPTTPSTSTTETFSGTIKQSATKSYPFTVTTAGTATIGLTSVSPLTTMALGVGIGTWDSTASTCTAITRNDNARAGATALTGTTTAGNYCVLVYDSGNIPSDWSVTFQGQVVHY